MINAAKALQLRAQRYAGLRIIEGQERGEINKKEDNRHSTNNKKGLVEIGITPNESSQYKKLASMNPFKINLIIKIDKILYK